MNIRTSSSSCNWWPDAATLSGFTGSARPQAYPSRPIRLIVGFSAGGSADIVARMIAQWLSDRLGQPVIVENRTGAASNLAAELVARRRRTVTRCCSHSP